MRRLAFISFLLAALAAVFAGIRQILPGSRTINGAVIHTPTDDTGIGKDGVVRSVQGADIIVDQGVMDGLWNPEHLERLARTYWKSLTRFTFGIIRVVYTPEERYVTVLGKVRLLTFAKPEYEMDACRGIVRWRIQQGLLVAPPGREGDGYLELDVSRHDYDDWDKTRIHVEVEVANFYPAIASSISRWVYVNTQSRIHVIACHVFLRSLVKRRLDVSKVGEFAGPPSAEAAPDPAPERTRARDAELSRR